MHSAYAPNTVIVTVSDDFDTVFGDEDSLNKLILELPDIFATNHEAFGIGPVDMDEVQVVYVVQTHASIVPELSIHFVVARDEPNHLTSYNYRDVILKQLGTYALPIDSVQLSSSTVASHGIWIQQDREIVW
ncbi:MAG: hypothetical protein EOP37_28670 [Rubrivivax sp.]|nr:MAG: hypothetical protein EOP37_28670 [Rubrivivax sp.]